MSTHRRKVGKCVSDPECLVISTLASLQRQGCTHLKRCFSLDLPHHRIGQWFIKLCKKPNKVKAWANVRVKETRTCCKTFIANCGVIAPLVINSSNESVKAMPILYKPSGYPSWSVLHWSSLRSRNDSRWPTVEFIICGCHSQELLIFG